MEGIASIDLFVVPTIAFQPALAFLVLAEIAMASANSEAPIVTRTQAERLLDLYFGLVPWTENNPLDRRS